MNLPTYLVIHAGYTTVHLGIFRGDACLDSLSEDKKTASQNMLIRMQELLAKHTLALTDLSFIAAYAGPGPFTTMRVAIATVNGLGFATGIPLISVDGIITFYQEYLLPDCPEPAEGPAHNTIVLLNAFCEDVYYGIKTATSDLKTGIANCDEFLEALHLSQPTHFIGNGTVLYREKIIARFGALAIIPTIPPLEEPPLETSLKAVAHSAYAHWQNNTNIVAQITPLYLKACAAPLQK